MSYEFVFNNLREKIKMARRENKIRKEIWKRFLWRGVELHGSIQKLHETLGNFYRSPLRAGFDFVDDAGRVRRLCQLGEK
jgi:hypothetical protein